MSDVAGILLDGYALLILGVLGITLLGLGVVNLSYGEHGLITIILVFVGAVMCSFAIAMTEENDIERKETLLTTIAHEINANPDEIIVNDGEDGSNLKFVYYQGKKFVFEMDGSEVKKVVEMKD